MKILQGINYLFGRFFNSQKTYINHSFLYLNRSRQIDRNYMDYIRIASLELIAEEINSNNLVGAVAELGVYKGKFARYINQYFPDRKLFLFDTFEGFDVKDSKAELESKFSDAKQDFSNTSVSEVLSRMSFPDQCVIKKGYFPQTAEGMNENFVFVSIDADLYDPIYSGLDFFYPKLVKGGYIFIHDFNNDLYKGAKAAVKKFCDEHGVTVFPLPDAAGTAVLVK